MLKKIILVTMSAGLVASAYAGGNAAAERSHALKDGSTVHVFADGKMGMEDRYGRSYSMPDGHIMETADGKTIVMQGNEVGRVDQLLRGNESGGI